MSVTGDLKRQNLSPLESPLQEPCRRRKGLGSIWRTYDGLAASRKVAVDLEKGLLHDPRRIRFARQMTRETKHSGQVAHDQRFEGSVIAGRGSRRKDLVARFRSGDDHALTSTGV
jgi:hypothetical protein